MKILEVLEQRGAVLQGMHFVYASKKHGPAYINVDPVFPDVKLLAGVCGELAYPFWGQVDTVAAAATGGIPLSYLTARSFGGEALPAAVWADKTDSGFAFERAGFRSALSGRRVLVVEDLLNTGGSVKAVIAQARSHGADIVGISAICNRGPETAETLDVPRLEALATVKMEMFDPDGCPLCAERRPIVVDVGHGAEFRDKHQDYAGRFTTVLS